jgi:hypothetical protein
LSRSARLTSPAGDSATGFLLSREQPGPGQTEFYRNLPQSILLRCEDD